MERPFYSNVILSQLVLCNPWEEDMSGVDRKNGTRERKKKERGTNGRGGGGGEPGLCQPLTTGSV